MHIRHAKRVMVIDLQLLCGGVTSHYGDSSYVGSKVLLQTDSKSCWRPSWQKMGVRIWLLPVTDPWWSQGLTVTWRFVNEAKKMPKISV